jgi:hypothetical protein
MGLVMVVMLNPKSENCHLTRAHLPNLERGDSFPKVFARIVDAQGSSWTIVFTHEIRGYSDGF